MVGVGDMVVSETAGVMLVGVLMMGVMMTMVELMMEIMVVMTRITMEIRLMHAAGNCRGKWWREWGGGGGGGEVLRQGIGSLVETVSGLLILFTRISSRNINYDRVSMPEHREISLRCGSDG